MEDEINKKQKQPKSPKLKVVLINPDYRIYGDPPLGLAYLAAYKESECFKGRFC